MHKTLIISDSHGWTDEVQQIRQRHSDIDNAIHCGDSELDEHDKHLKNYQTVKGNCDWTGDFPEEIIYEYGGLTFLITHGHLFGIKSSLMKLEYRAQEVDADVICFGHSHIAYAEEKDGRLFINPGSIRLPRQYPEGSYAILSWENASHLQLDFFNVKGVKITEFVYPNTFNLK